MSQQYETGETNLLIISNIPRIGTCEVISVLAIKVFVNFSENLFKSIEYGRCDCIYKCQILCMDVHVHIYEH